VARVSRQTAVVFLAGTMILMFFAVPANADEPFPYEMKTGTEVGLVLTAAACYGAGWWLERDFRTLIPEEVDALNSATLNSFDWPAASNWSPGADRVSDFMVTGQLVLPLGLNFSDTGSLQPIKVTAMYLETMAINTGLTYLLKNHFNRARPYVYNDDPRIGMDLKTSANARKSFPSGHTANAFAAMVFLGSVYEEMNPGGSSTGLVWGACLTSAAVTGALRVTSGRHFASDVVAGAVLGSLVGWVVPRLHEIDETSGAGAAGPGVKLSYGFVF
jgi:membrane-associated phospholipid phosphatase